MAVNITAFDIWVGRAEMTEATVAAPCMGCVALPYDAVLWARDVKRRSIRTTQKSHVSSPSYAEARDTQSLTETPTGPKTI